MRGVTISIIDTEVDGITLKELYLIYKSQVIGGCHIAYMNTTPTILAVFISKPYRGKGLCRRLMDKCHEIIVTEGKKRTAYLFVHEDNTIVNFYERLGYKLTGQMAKPKCKWMSKVLKNE